MFSYHGGEFSGAIMKKFALEIAAIAALMTTPAVAAGTKAPPAPVAAPYSWTGWYMGGNVGFGWSRQSVDFSPVGPTVGPPPAPISFDAFGPMIGFQIGYNWQVSQTWLIGFETDFDISGISGSGASTTIVPTTKPPSPFQATADQHLEWFGTVRGRAGYLASNSLLVYGTGGFAYGRTTQQASDVNQSGINFVAGLAGPICNAMTVCYFGALHHIATGWTAGGGLEYVLSAHWTVRGEYLFVKLSGNTVAENFAGTSTINANFHDLAINIVRAGVSYKF